MKQTLKLIGPEDIRAMLAARQGWDPGPLDAALAKPLSDKTKQSALVKRLKIQKIPPGWE